MVALHLLQPPAYVHCLLPTPSSSPSACCLLHLQPHVHSCCPASAVIIICHCLCNPLHFQQPHLNSSPLLLLLTHCQPLPSHPLHASALARSSLLLSSTSPCTSLTSLQFRFTFIFINNQQPPRTTPSSSSTSRHASSLPTSTATIAFVSAHAQATFTAAALHLHHTVTANLHQPTAKKSSPSSLTPLPLSASASQQPHTHAFCLHLRITASTHPTQPSRSSSSRLFFLTTCYPPSPQHTHTNLILSAFIAAPAAHHQTATSRTHCHLHPLKPSLNSPCKQHMPLPTANATAFIITATVFHHLCTSQPTTSIKSQSNQRSTSLLQQPHSLCLALLCSTCHFLLVCQLPHAHTQKSFLTCKHEHRKRKREKDKAALKINKKKNK